MKKFILPLGFVLILAACGDGGGTVSSGDSTTTSDTTGLHLNPATEDPNSNMADTMKMKDSLRVQDTTVKKQ